MQLPAFLTRLLGRTAFEFAAVQPLIPTYLHLLVSATFPIYAGAHSSLSRPSSAAKKPRRNLVSEKDDDSSDEEEETPPMEGLTTQDALLFPVLAGITLTSLYFLIKWLQDLSMLNKILNWYFAAFSIFSVSRLVSDGLDVLHSLIFPHDHVDAGVLFHVDSRKRLALSTPSGTLQRRSPLPWVFSRLPLPQIILNTLWMLHELPYRKPQFHIFVRRILDIRFRLGIHGIEGLLVGICTVLWYNFVSKPWWLTNLMGFGFAYGSLQLMSPTTFWTGTLILSGLFCYDIYFVFFTPMMVTVAKSLDVPIKLLFPRPPDPDSDPKIIPLSMLGLGDIVLPGIVIGLALRFDLFMYYLRKQTKNRREENLQSPEEARKGVDNTDDTEADANKESSSSSDGVVSKAPYLSVAEAWGDLLWTSSIMPGTFQNLNYTARNNFPKPYFNATMIGYVLGMLVTLGAMQISNHPQPALLYLVPGVLISLWGTAVWKGEVKEVWTFSDAAEEVEEKTKSQDKKDSKEISKGQQETREAKQTSFFSSARSEARSRKIAKVFEEESQGDVKGNPRPNASDDIKKRVDNRWIRFSINFAPRKHLRRSNDGGDSKNISQSGGPHSLRDHTTKVGDRPEKRQRLS